MLRMVTKSKCWCGWNGPWSGCSPGTLCFIFIAFQALGGQKEVDKVERVSEENMVATGNEDTGFGLVKHFQSSSARPWPDLVQIFFRFIFYIIKVAIW